MAIDPGLPNLKLATQLSQSAAPAPAPTAVLVREAFVAPRRGIAELASAALATLPSIMGAEALLRASTERTEQARGALRPIQIGRAHV